MYFNSETVHAAKLAALDDCQLASNILLDSTARLIDLYRDTGSKVFDLARRNEPPPDPTLFKQLVHEHLQGHLLVATYAHEDFVRFLTTQMHSTNSLAKFALEKTAKWSPPMIELAVNTTESLIEAGESAENELGGAMLRETVEAEKKLEYSLRAKKRAWSE